MVILSRTLNPLRPHQEFLLPKPHPYTLVFPWLLFSETGLDDVNHCVWVCIKEVGEGITINIGKMNDAMNSARKDVIGRALQKIAHVENEGIWDWWNADEISTGVQHLERRGGS